MKIILSVFGMALLVALPACGSGSASKGSEPQSCGTDSGEGCAPDSQRVDRYEPSFSKPTDVTNPLFPIGELRSVVFLGIVDGKAFRSETTLLPETRSITWKGRQVQTLSSQYMAFSEGRIQEIATDWYAQDDNGAVWYFGEDVADYNEEGVVYTHEGTWLVGKDNAPLTMIMPAHPQPGNVYRAENVSPIAWEEVTVQSVGVTKPGPSGPVQGVMVGSELHMDETRQEKVFAPGYGEFSTGSLETDDLEALAVAVPADALASGLPPELEAMSSGAAQVFDTAAAADWPVAADALARMVGAWMTYRTGGIPPRLEAPMSDALSALNDAVVAQSAGEARHQAIAVARATFDFRLRHQPPSEVDRVRLDLWLAQAIVDAAAANAGASRGSCATAEFVWDRIAHTFNSTQSADIERQLGELLAAADAEDAGEVVSRAETLRATLAASSW